jgi:hypothetical protein
VAAFVPEIELDACRAREQNAFLKTHSWEEYAAWQIGLTERTSEGTKARYVFV